MRRSTRSSSSSATLAYCTFSTEVGSSPICCTRLLAAATGFRISCAMVDDSSPRLACFSVCMAARWERGRGSGRPLEEALAEEASAEDRHEVREDAYAPAEGRPEEPEMVVGVR